MLTPRAKLGDRSKVPQVGRRSAFILSSSAAAAAKNGLCRDHEAKIAVRDRVLNDILKPGCGEVDFIIAARTF